MTFKGDVVRHRYPTRLERVPTNGPEDHYRGSAQTLKGTGTLFTLEMATEQLGARCPSSDAASSTHVGASSDSTASVKEDPYASRIPTFNYQMMTTNQWAFTLGPVFKPSRRTDHDIEGLFRPRIIWTRHDLKQYTLHLQSR